MHCDVDDAVYKQNESSIQQCAELGSQLGNRYVQSLGATNTFLKMFQGDILGNPGLEAKAGGDSRKFWVITVNICLADSHPLPCSFLNFVTLSRYQMIHVARVPSQPTPIRRSWRRLQSRNMQKRKSLRSPDMSWSGTLVRLSRWEVTGRRSSSST